MWGLGTVTVRRRLVPLTSPSEGFSGDPPCTEASLNKVQKISEHLSQIGQAATNRRASLAMDGHQKRCLINL